MNRRSFLQRAGFAGAGAFGASLVPITRGRGPSLSPGPNGQIALGAPANQLDVAFEDLTAAHWGEGHDAIATILAAAQSQDAVVQAEVERRFIALLEGPSTQAAKRFACAQLARIGGEGSVATLAAIHCSTGILWTAHVDVPINGAPCVITPEDMVLEKPDP